MYIDSINKKGGINGKKIKLLVFDDHGDVNIAKKVASDIVAQNKAVVVLGHINSDACIAARKIYKEAKIPIISATCSVDAVTEGNKWYFKTVPNSSSNGIFLANYIKKVMNPNDVSIIYGNQYTTIAKSFHNSFRGLKGKIKHKIIIDKYTDIDQQVKEIIQTFLQDKPNFVFLTMDNNIIKKIIVAIKRNGLTFPIFARNLLPDTKLFDEYFEEQLSPGFFSNGVFTDSLLISDMAGESVQKIRREYIKKYRKTPSWVVITAYEAAKIAVKAISETQANNLIEKRKKVRNYLASRTSMENGLSGVDDKFYFDKYGNAVKPLSIGVFKNRKIISALTQFSPVYDMNFISNLKQELAKGRITIINKQYMHKTDIVYTGIDFN